MRINPFWMPLLTLVALLGTIVAAQAAGQWSTSGRTSVNLAALNPADIKGWMTLQQVMDGFGLSQTELYGMVGIPEDVEPATALKDLEGIVPDFEVSTLREKLEEYVAGQNAPSDSQEVNAAPSPTNVPEATATPQATPTAMPQATSMPVPQTTEGATATRVPGTPSGTHSGATSTPLPPGQVLPADQIKGKMSLGEISTQCGVPLDALLAKLGLAADTNPSILVKDLVAQGKLEEMIVVQQAVAELQAK